MAKDKVVIHLLTDDCESLVCKRCKTSMEVPKLEYVDSDENYERLLSDSQSGYTSCEIQP